MAVPDLERRYRAGGLRSLAAEELKGLAIALHTLFRADKAFIS